MIYFRLLFFTYGALSIFANGTYANDTTPCTQPIPSNIVASINVLLLVLLFDGATLRTQ